MRTQLPQKKRHSPLTQFLAHVYCGQTAGWIKVPLGTKIDLGLGTLCETGAHQLPVQNGTAAPSFGQCLLWPRSTISVTVELLFYDRDSLTNRPTEKLPLIKY